MVEVAATCKITHAILTYICLWSHLITAHKGSPHNVIHSSSIFHLVDLAQLVVKLLKPNAPITKTTIGRINPGTGVQSSCNITKVIWNNTTVTTLKINQTRMARYLPSHNSATQPVTGSNTKKAWYVQSRIVLCVPLRLSLIAKNTNNCTA